MSIYEYLREFIFSLPLVPTNFFPLSSLLKRCFLMTISSVNFMVSALISILCVIIFVDWSESLCMYVFMENNTKWKTMDNQGRKLFWTGGVGVREQVNRCVHLLRNTL